MAILTALGFVLCSPYPRGHTGLIVGNNRCAGDPAPHDIADMKGQLRAPFLSIGRLYVTRGTRSLANLRARTEGLLRIAVTHDSVFVVHDSLARPDISSRAVAILRREREALDPLHPCDTAFFDLLFSHDAFPAFYARDTTKYLFYHFPPSIPRMYQH